MTISRGSLSKQLSRRDVMRLLAGTAVAAPLAAIALKDDVLATESGAAQRLSAQPLAIRRPSSSSTMTVGALSLASSGAASRPTLTATLQVVSGSAGVRSARVTLEFKPPAGRAQRVSGYTNSSGALTSSRTFSGPGDYTVRVMSVSKRGYRYDSSQSTPTAGTTVGAEPAPPPSPTPSPTPTPIPIVAPSNGLSLLDHGARGDGSSDDTQAMLRAISAAPDGGVITIPSGRYKIGDFSIDKPVTLRGEPNAELVGTSTISINSSAAGLRVEQLAFTGGAGFYTWRGRNLTFSGCRFQDIDGTGISIAPAEDVLIENCEFVNIKYSGVRLNEIAKDEVNRRITVRNCRFVNVSTAQSAGHGAIAAHGWSEHHQLVIENCHIESQFIGLALDTVFDSRVSNCRIVGNGSASEGIAFSGSRNQFTGNVVNNFDAAGILHWGTDYQGGQDDNVVSGNEVYDCRQGFAFIQGSWNTPMRNTRFEGNRCYDSGSGITQEYGIQTYQGWEGTPEPMYENIQILNNDLRDNSRGGWSFMGSSDVPSGVALENNQA